MKRGVTLATRALAATSLFLAAYVVYAHLASFRRGREYRATARIESFSSEAKLKEAFALDATPGLDARIEGSTLRVTGRCDGAGSRVQLLLAPTRLVSAVARMRFRALADAPVDVMVGVTREGAKGRELRFGEVLGMSRGALAFVGDQAPHEPPKDGDRRILTLPSMSVASTDAAVREIALGLEPELGVAVGSVDGAVIQSIPAYWFDGALVRPTFSVVCRDASPRVDIEIRQVAWEPVARDVSVVDLDDDFRGTVFDPRWRIARPATPDLADVHVGTGGGLSLSAKGKSILGPTPLFSLTAPRMALESFDATLDLRLTRLERGAVYFGVANGLGGVFFRSFDVGVTSRDGRLVPFVTGHFGDAGQLQFRTLEGNAGPLGQVQLRLRYDAHSRLARAFVDGRQVFEERSFLQPYEQVAFHVVANLDHSSGAIDGVVERVQFARKVR